MPTWVPTWPYYEEGNFSSQVAYEDSYIATEYADLPTSEVPYGGAYSQTEGFPSVPGTLMFIANQGEPRHNLYPPRPYAQAQRPQRTLGPCFGC